MKARATITLYFNPETFEDEAETPFTASELYRIGTEINDFCAHISGYEAWQDDWPNDD